MRPISLINSLSILPICSLKHASSPALYMTSLISLVTLLTTSSILPGWIRPSLIKASNERRAISRRIGLKHETVIVSGVSSIIKSTPVACSIARILRPSLPMIRPFISSEGNPTTDTHLSIVSS